MQIPISISHARTQKERVPEEAAIGVLPKSFDFFTGSRFFPKACNFSKSRDRTHTRCQKERVPEEAKIGVFPNSFDFFTRPQGARTSGWPPHTNPGLRPHTPPVKNIPGGQPHFPPIIIIIIIIVMTPLKKISNWY